MLWLYKQKILELASRFADIVQLCDILETKVFMWKCLQPSCLLLLKERENRKIWVYLCNNRMRAECGSDNPVNAREIAIPPRRDDTEGNSSRAALNVWIDMSARFESDNA